MLWDHSGHLWCHFTGIVVLWSLNETLVEYSRISSASTSIYSNCVITANMNFLFACNENRKHVYAKWPVFTLTAAWLNLMKLQRQPEVSSNSWLNLHKRQILFQYYYKTQVIETTLQPVLCNLPVRGNFTLTVIINSSISDSSFIIINNCHYNFKYYEL